MSAISAGEIVFPSVPPAKAKAWFKLLRLLHRGLQAGLHVERRLEPFFRRGFNRKFREPLADFLQERINRRRVDEGLKLCQHSIKVEFYQVENYLNLARTCLLAQDRKGAVKAVRGGLKIDPHQPELLGLYRDLGIRSLPVLPFLDRRNPVNQLLGRIRHAFRQTAAPPKTS